LRDRWLLAAGCRSSAAAAPALERQQRGCGWAELWQTVTSMRVYLPSTLSDLAVILRARQIQPGTAYAVTPALREAYASGDQEELEYVALTQAARASLRLLAADPQAPRRRVVLAADVDDSLVGITTHPITAHADSPAQVAVTVPIATTRLVSAHVDDPQAENDIQKAIQALPEADQGDDDAAFEVDQAEGHELAWYATQELPDLVSAV
jgi:hypothetical protein